jgi:ABC-type lipoprotein release transport system permease subunit
MLVLKMATRNIFRNKKRTTVLSIAIWFGVLIVIFTSSSFKGISQQRVRDAIDIQIGDLQIHNKKFSENYELDEYIEDDVQINKMLSKVPGIEYAERNIVNGTVSSANSSYPTQITGIDTQKEEKVSTIMQYIEKGTKILPDSRNKILIGEGLAKKLKVKLKSKIVLTMQDADGDLVGGAFRVAGIFETVNSEFDKMYVFVSGKDLRRIIRIDKPHEIAIQITDKKATAESIKAIIKPNLPEKYIVEKWDEVVPDLRYFADLINGANLIFFSIILVAMGFGIMDLMFISIFERTREIGTLMIVGFSRSQAALMIIYETMILFIAGGTAGIIGGIILTSIFEKIGMNLTFLGGMETVGIDSMVYPLIDLTFLSLAFLVMCFIALLSSLMPMFKVLKIKPAEAVRS